MGNAGGRGVSPLRPVREFNPQTDSLLLQKWWIDLAADPAEFELLFCKPLRNLPQLAMWTTRLKLFVEDDWKGIWFAGWMAPLLTNGGEVGMWIRKDRRGMPATLKSVDFFIDDVILAGVPTFIGITRQYPKLHALHLKLGYTYVDEFPGIFDGETAWMYKMTRESRAQRAEVIARFKQERAARRAAYVGIHKRTDVVEGAVPEPADESLRRSAGEDRASEREGSGAGHSTIIGTGIRTVKDWWYNKPDPDREPSNRHGASVGVDERAEHR